MFWSRLRALGCRLRRPALWERALDDELKACIDEEVNAKIQAGVPPVEARRTALAEFGGLEPVKEQVRAGVTGAWFDTLRQDVRCARRALQHARGYTCWVVASLTIGMAITIAALALLNALMILPFPQVTEQKRLVRISMSRNCGRPDCWVRMSTPTDYDAVREGLAGLQAVAAYTMGDVAVALPDARRMLGVVTSPNYFEVLGVRPAVGRMFSVADAESNAPVAVLAHGAWTREFDADPSVIGRSIRVGDQFVQIVGVAPALFIGIDRRPRGTAAGPRRMEVGRSPDMWLPIWMADRVLPLTAGEHRRGERDLYFVGRLKDGIEVPQLQAEANVLALRLAASKGQGPSGGRAEVLRVWQVNPRNWPLGIILVMPIPILVLMIASVNAANLMLARGSQRQREIAIRLAIGAGRSRIIRQLLIESAVLATLAAGAAVCIAWWGLQFASSPLASQIPIDSTVLALTVLTALATTMAFGLAPAVRVSAQRPSSTLGPVGATDALPRQSRMRRVLVVAQLALSVGLLATGSQLIATVRSQAVSSGTPPNRLLIVRFDLRPLKLAPSEVDSFYRDLAVGASRLPGVEATGIARHTSVWTFGQGAAPASVLVWRPTDAPDAGRVILGGYAGDQLFEAVGLRTVSGRTFTDADRGVRPQVAVVNDTAAKNIAGPVVGTTLRIAPRNQDYNSSIEVRIVGIIEPAIEPRLERGESPPAKIYLPSPIEPEPALALYLRTRAIATASAQPVRELVSQISSRVPIVELGSLEELNERSYALQLWLARAAASVGLIGLLLATAGLYGVSSYVVAMRSREMAIRMAVGARPRAILTMVLGQSMRVASIGLLVGGATAAAVSRWIQSEYHGIQGIDPMAFGGATLLFLAAMLLASVVPAVRASRLDPVENLRND